MTSQPLTTSAPRTQGRSQGRSLISVPRLAIFSGLAVILIAALSGVVGSMILGYSVPILLAAVGVLMVGLAGIMPVAGFLTLLPADDAGSLAFRMLSCGLIRGAMTVIGILVFQLSLKPAAPVLVLGLGVVWAALTVIELSMALPILRASQSPQSGGSNTNNPTSSDARNA